MDSWSAFAAPSFVSADDGRAFGDALRRAGYSVKGLCALFGAPTLEAIDKLSPPLLVMRAAGPTPLHVLVRLFVLGQPVPAGDVANALAPLHPQALVDAGVILPHTESGEGVVAALGLTPYEDIAVLHDRPRGADMREDWVMGVAGTTKTVATQMIRRRAEDVLDIGTGCGPLAILASRHAGRVLGTDINGRAMALARMNALVNRAENAEFAEGSWLEPAAGRTFDQIVCNPPFVMAPKGLFMYRDSGLAGDEIAQKLIREGAPLLKAGGFLQMVCNYAHVKGQPWRERLKGWFAGTGCDALVVTKKTFNLVEYAAAWIDETENVPPDAKWTVLNQWLEFFAGLSIEAIGEAVIVMHRPAGAARENWFATDDLPEKSRSGMGDHLLEIFGARDFLAACPEGGAGDEKLLASRLAWSPALRLEQQMKPGASGWAAVKSDLALSRGYAFSRPATTNDLKFVQALDGSRTVRQAAEAAGAGAPALAALCARLCRQLLERGYVVPAGG